MSRDQTPLEDDVQSLADYFRGQGYLVERQDVGDATGFVVASQPEVASGIPVYQRSARVRRSPQGEWLLGLGMLTLPWQESVDSLRTFVSAVMESTFDEYLERQRQWYAKRPLDVRR